MLYLVKLPFPSLVNLSLMTLLTLGAPGQSYGLVLNQADQTGLPGLSGSLFRLSTPARSPAQHHQCRLTADFSNLWLSAATLRLESGKLSPRRSIEAYGSYPINSAYSLEYQGHLQSRCNKKLAILSAAIASKQTAVVVTQSLSMGGFSQQPRRLLGGYSSTALNLSYTPIRIPGLQGNLEVRQALLRKQGRNLQAACHPKQITVSASYQPISVARIKYTFSQASNENANHQLGLALSFSIGHSWAKQLTQTGSLHKANGSAVAQQVAAAVEASETATQLDSEAEQRVPSDEPSGDHCNTSDPSPNQDDDWSLKMTSDETVATPVVLPSVGERNLSDNLLLSLKDAALEKGTGLPIGDLGVPEELNRLIDWRNKQGIFSDAVYKPHNLSLLNYASDQLPTCAGVNQYYENVFLSPIKYTYELSHLAALGKGKVALISSEAIVDEIYDIATYCYENLHIINQKGYFSGEKYREFMLKPLEGAEVAFNQYIEGNRSITRDTFFDLHSRSILKNLLSKAPATDSLRDGSTKFRNRILYKLVKEIFFGAFSDNYAQLEKAGLITEQDKALAVNYSEILNEGGADAYLRPELGMMRGGTVDSVQMMDLGLEADQKKSLVAQLEMDSLLDQIDQQPRNQELKEQQEVLKYVEKFAKTQEVRGTNTTSLRQLAQNRSTEFASRDQALSTGNAEQDMRYQKELAMQERIEGLKKAQPPVRVTLPLEYASTVFLLQPVNCSPSQCLRPTVIESPTQVSPVTTVGEATQLVPGPTASSDAANYDVSEGLDWDKSTLRGKKKG